MGEGGREMALLHRLVGWKAVAQEKAGDVRRETSCPSFRLKYIYIYIYIYTKNSILGLPWRSSG